MQIDQLQLQYYILISMCDLILSLLYLEDGAICDQMIQGCWVSVACMLYKQPKRVEAELEKRE